MKTPQSPSRTPSHSHLLPQKQPHPNPVLQSPAALPLTYHSGIEAGRSIHKTPHYTNEPDNLLALQRTCGNQMVGHLIQMRRKPAKPASTPRAKEEPAEALITKLTHPKIILLQVMMQALGSMQALLEFPAEALDTKAKRKQWEERLWEELSETGAHGRYKEAGKSITEALVEIVGWTRALINGLDAEALTLTAAQLTQVKGYYHRKLNGFTPYFTQMANRNILWLGKRKRGAKKAWIRTCSMTSLGMALQAMGVNPGDFIGDQALLARIAQELDPELKQFADLQALRMPDFLQLVAVYTKYRAGQKDHRREVARARNQAAMVVSTELSVFEQISELFGVRKAKVGYISTTGSKKHNGSDEQVATQKYRKAVEKQLEPWLNQGGQVIVNKPKHYVRLENIESSGIVIDDPAADGKNFKMAWDKANRGGYFRRYMVFMK